MKKMNLLIVPAILLSLAGTASLTKTVSVHAAEKSGIARSDGSKEIVIKDENLLEQIKLALQKKLGTDVVSKENLEKIDKLKIQQLEDEDDWKVKNLEGIENLTNLESLSIIGAKINDASPLSSLKKLKSVNLKGSNVHDLSPLTGLTNLETLVLDNNPISTLDGIENLTKLKTLSMQSSFTVNDEGIHHIKNLSNLEKLNLNNNQIVHIDELNQLKNLYFLDLSSNKISDISGLHHLSLESLFLNKNSISTINNLSSIAKEYYVTDQSVKVSPVYVDNNDLEKNIIIENPIKDNDQSPVELQARNSKNGIYHADTNKMEWFTSAHTGNRHANWKSKANNFSGEIVQPYFARATFKGTEGGTVEQPADKALFFAPKNEVTISLEQGSKLTKKVIPDATPQTGYSFDHWEDEKGKTVTDWKSIYLDTNMSFTAKFKKDGKDPEPVTGGASQSADANVNYRNTKDIPDPDNPLDPDYVVSVPGNITFTDDNKQYNRDLHMYMPDGIKDYAGSKTAEVSVKSANGFKLTNVKDKADTVDYKMIELGDKAVELKGTADNTLGMINKDANNIKMRYKLAGEAMSTSVYQDTVTYTVTSK